MSAVRIVATLPRSDQAAGLEPRVAYTALVSHGGDPETMLAAAGWRATWMGAERDQDDLVLRYEVTPDEMPVRYQRVSAYAVVLATVAGERSVLLTSFRRSRTGAWGLVGGGIDAGEQPLEALHREVWEESGQRVRIERPLEAASAHWIGTSPRGRYEDFHVLRLSYQARCPDPSDPVVHDVGGSTEQARWVPWRELEDWPLSGWARSAIEAAHSG